MFVPSWLVIGEDKAAVPVTDTEFSQSVNPQNFCTGVSLHHQALIQNSGPLIDMSDIRPGTSEFSLTPYIPDQQSTISTTQACLNEISRPLRSKLDI